MIALDHIVIASKDPKKSAERFGHAHDVITVQGGNHENWGTHNYLAFFSNDCYIEWLGVYDDHKASQSDNPLVIDLIRILKDYDEYAYQFALRTNDIHCFTDHFQTKHIPFVGPIAGKRKRPDHSILSWQMLFPIIETGPLLPFLIEWGETINKPQNQQDINQACITSLTLPTRHLDLMTSVYHTEHKNNAIKLENSSILFKPQSDGLMFNVE